MKHTRTILVLGLALLLIISACSSSPTPATATLAPVVQDTEIPTQPPADLATEPEASATSVPDTAVPTQAAVPTLTDAEMEALITEKAHDKHTLNFILSKNFTREKWSETLDRMIGYGAKISPEEKEMIIEWLVNRK